MTWIKILRMGIAKMDECDRGSGPSLQQWFLTCGLQVKASPGNVSQTQMLRDSIPGTLRLGPTIGPLSDSDAC